MPTKPRIALVISSTRPTRWADKPKEWILRQMQARGDMEVEVLDLRDFDLPFFDEPASNAYMPTQNPEAIRFQREVARFDGYVFLVAEYNRAITGALKNALDWDYVNWGRKPMGAVGYGTVGAARAIENLRTISIEMQMVPVRTAVHIGGSDFFRVGPYNPNPEPIEAIEQSVGGQAKDMLDQVVWYARVLKPAREAEGTGQVAA
jgi:NAD(P)H-dependent FMN reductase